MLFHFVKECKSTAFELPGMKDSADSFIDRELRRENSDNMVRKGCKARSGIKKL